MKLIGIDLGTTNCKVGLFDREGNDITVLTRPMITYTDKKLGMYYHAKELWENIYDMLKEVKQLAGEEIGAIGITSMSETGLLVDKETHEEKTNLLPWFNQNSKKAAAFVKTQDDPYHRFTKTGLRVNHKFGLSKILFLKEVDERLLDNAVWLSTSDYIAFKLTDVFATDYTLAARTYALDINTKKWDEDWIRKLGLSPEIFPQVLNSGERVGLVKAELGLGEGIAVAICGHDHLCASVGAGLLQVGSVFNSMGTAETVVGITAELGLNEKKFDSLVTFGNHVLTDMCYWMKSIQTSGGCVEWMRNNLYENHLSYGEIIEILEKKADDPTGILFFPYLSGGSGTKGELDSATFMGLTKEHDKGDMIKSVFEGLSYQFDYVKEGLKDVLDVELDEFTVVGGSTKNKAWMQLKADITGAKLDLPEEPEATLLGAVIVAGIGLGIYQDVKEVEAIFARREKEVIVPKEGAGYEEMKAQYVRLHGVVY